MHAKEIRLSKHWSVGYATQPKSIGLCGDDIIGFVRHNLYDDTAYALYVWRFCVYVNKKWHPEPARDCK